MRKTLMTFKVPLALLALLLAAAAPLAFAGVSDLRQAESEFAAGEYETAAGYFESAARRWFWRADLWERAGQAALYAGRPEETVRLLGGRATLSQSGQHTLGQAYIRTGDLDTALRIYQSMLSESGGSVEAYAGLAMIHHLNGDWAGERAAWQNLTLLLPEQAAAHFRLGELLMLSDSGAALDHLLLASQLDPEYDAAVQTLRTSVNLSELQPDESQRLMIVGRGLGLVEEWPLAAEAFGLAVDEDQGNAEAWAWLGEAKQHLDQDGSREIERALALDPGSAIVRALRGLYWKREGNHRAALAEYQAAAELEPDNTAWKTALGETYARLGDLVSALAAYRSATEQSPQDATTWRLLATFCVEYGVQVQEVGLPAALNAAALAPDDALALDVLGWNQLNADQYYSAEQSLLRALKIAPDLASAHLHLALAYLKSGQIDSAREHLERVLALDPDGLYGRQAEQVLNQNFP